MGCVGALCLWGATAVLMVKGAPPGAAVGPHLALLTQLSSRLQRLLARKRCRPVLRISPRSGGWSADRDGLEYRAPHLSRPSRHAPLFCGRPVAERPMLDDAERKVLNAAIRVNTVIMAVAMGLLCAAILWSSTAILLLRGGPDVGAHLSLLSVFLPRLQRDLERCVDRLVVGIYIWRAFRDRPLLELRPDTPRTSLRAVGRFNCSQQAHASDIPVLG